MPPQQGRTPNRGRSSVRRRRWLLRAASGLVVDDSYAFRILAKGHAPACAVTTFAQQQQAGSECRRNPGKHETGTPLYIREAESGAHPGNSSPERYEEHTAELQ